MADKKKIITDLREALDSVDITSDLRLVLIHAIEYLQRESASEDLEEELHSWMRENCDDNGFFNPLALARHFAKWQQKKDQESLQESLKTEKED